MKTSKKILFTAMLLLGAVLYGQALQVRYADRDYAETGSSVENLVDNFLSMTDRRERKEYREPVVYKSYTFTRAELVYEEQYVTENWMASPFDCGVAEDKLNIEDWMTSPFESSLVEAELSLDPWMTVPFGSVAEIDPIIEKWMTLPFEAAEHIEIESWMTAPF